MNELGTPPRPDSPGPDQAPFRGQPSPRTPIVVALLGTGFYYLSSFVPFSGVHGATYPAIDFRLSARFWGPDLARDTLLALVRIGAVVVATRSPRWRRAAWGGLIAIGVAGIINAVGNFVSILNALNPGTPEIGAYLYLVSHVLLLWAGILGLRQTGEPERSAGPPGPGSPTMTNGLLFVGCLAALLPPLALSPVTARANYGAPYYVIARNPDTSAVRWDVCRSIVYVVNTSEAPAGIQPTIEAAIGEVSAATGVGFVSDGPTTEQATRDRPQSIASYGLPYAPVLITWAKPGEGGVSLNVTRGVDAYGVTYPSWTATGGGSHEWVSGEIVLNARDALPTGFATSPAWGPVLLHELGHLMGLDHSNSPFDIMYPGPDFARHYSAADRIGLRAVGIAGGCP